MQTPVHEQLADGVNPERALAHMRTSRLTWNNLQLNSTQRITHLLPAIQSLLSPRFSDSVFGQ